MHLQRRRTGGSQTTRFRAEDVPPPPSGDRPNSDDDFVPLPERKKTKPPPTKGKTVAKTKAKPASTDKAKDSDAGDNLPKKKAKKSVPKELQSSSSDDDCEEEGLNSDDDVAGEADPYADPSPGGSKSDPFTAATQFNKQRVKGQPKQLVYRHTSNYNQRLKEIRGRLREDDAKNLLLAQGNVFIVTSEMTVKHLLLQRHVT